MIPRLPSVLRAIGRCWIVAAVCSSGFGQGQADETDALLNAHRYSDAMDRYEAALTANARNEQARNGEVAAANAWAAEQAHQGHAEQAMEILERALVRLPNEPKLLVSFGLEATALGQFPIADQALHAADKLKPGNPETIYALARLEIEEQHMPDAERDLKTYLALRPKDATAWYGLGFAYAMEQRNEDARKAFEQSIALQPQQTESYYQLGHLAAEAHQDAEAQPLLEKALSRNPKHAGALTDMGQIALRAKDYVKAEQLLADAEKSDPGYATPHYYRGLALARLGRKEEAEREMKLGDSRPHATSPTPSTPAGSTAQPAPQQPPGRF